MLARAYVRESVDPSADRAIDWLGIVLSAVGLGGPVYALIEQPREGWGSPVVYIPLIGGIVLFALFLVWESRYKHAMLDLSLFRIRNFAITNVETLIVYAGLIGAFFFLTLFLQQTAGYSPARRGIRDDPRPRCCCSSSLHASGESPPARGRACRCAWARSSAESGCCC